MAQRAEGIVQTYHGLERELAILADEITTRTANHVPVAADELERWLMRSQNINQQQLYACADLNELGSSLNETARNDGVGVFLRGLFESSNEQPRSKLRGIEHPSLNSFRGKPRGIEPEEIEGFGAAAQAFTVAVTTAATSQRD